MRKIRSRFGLGPVKGLLRRRAGKTRSRCACAGRLHFEPLEPRIVLQGGPLLISEFMAINDTTLLDGDGNFSDWIEIYNPTGARVDLDRWYLTDNAGNLTKWPFPNVSLDSGGYLVVFASGGRGEVVVEPGEPFDPYVDPAGHFHTNFKLDGDGEYLALTHEDGLSMAIAHEYAPKYPDQAGDISFGLSDLGTSWDTLVAAGDPASYHVPTAADADSGTAWTAVDFDDSSWNGREEPACILVTEIGTTITDFIEIQNVSDKTVDTSGWVVALNHGLLAPINDVHPILWHLPDSMEPGEILHRNDSTWGSDIVWASTGPNWAMILDDQGNVVDFIPWKYQTADLAALNVTINGFPITIGDAWSGASFNPLGIQSNLSFQRQGSSDGNTAADWAIAPETPGTQNAGLTTPFTTAVRHGLGFSQIQPNPFAGDIQIDVGNAMYGVNASLWSRIEFDVPDMSQFDELMLRMKYDDGFVAYLNGVKIAERNAPAESAYNSAATAAHPNAQAVVFEEIDVTEHLLFALKPGANVLAIHGLNVAAGDGDFLILPELVATSHLDDPQYMTTPTPRNTNVPGTLGWVKDTNFSVDRGFCTEAFDVEITTSTAGAEIRYTLDGSKPTETIGQVYDGPITIGTTTMLRAVAYKTGYTSTNVDTQTYIFPEHVATQTRPVDYPTRWGGESNADYDVDQNISMSGQYHDRFVEGLTDIPTMSIVLPMADFFGSSGLYSNTTNVSLEKEASAELIYPDGRAGFQIDAGLKIQGGASRSVEATIKHSLSLRFRQIYGEGRLDYPLFGDWPVDRFNSLQLRAMYNNSWIHRDSGQRNRAQLIRDQWARDSLTDMGQADAGQGIYVHVYINGLYWGVYNLHERQEASHYAEYNGGDDDTLDAYNANVRIDGLPGSTAYSDMKAAVAGRDWYAIQQVLDVDNYIDFYLIEHFSHNNDLKLDGNWRAAGGGPDQMPWRFYSWDTERILENPDSTGPLDVQQDPVRIFDTLMTIPEFQMRFADRLHKHLFNDGALTPEKNTERWEERANEIDLAIIGESARWGDDRREPPYTRDAEWMTERNRLVNPVTGYFAERTDNMIAKYRANGQYPATNAPVFTVNGSYQHGGELAGGVLRATATSGVIYYTTDGSDPRLEGGSPNPAAMVVSSGTAIPLGASAVVKSRALNGGQWSALNEAQFYAGQPASAENLAITELNYNPYPPVGAELDIDDVNNDYFEFVELRNLGNQIIDLTGVEFTEGIHFSFSDGQTRQLGPGQYVVIVANQAAFEIRYDDDLNVAGTYTGLLANNGERIALRSSRTGETIFDFSFNDAGGWSGRADGKGATLELVDPAAVPVNPAEDRAAYLENDDHWRSSIAFAGTPAADPAQPTGVVINEVLTHTDDPWTDAVELHNTTDQPVDVGGWYLSDEWGWESSPADGDYRRFRIPTGTVIPPHGYAAFYEGHFVGGVLYHDDDEFGGTGLKDFALNGAEGDDVWLMAADPSGNLTRFADHVGFGPAANGESFGRWPDATGELVPMIERTLGRENTGPRIGPVIFSEIMYSPDIDGYEFVELYNTTNQPVVLFDPANPSHTWRIDGIGFDFPVDVVIPSFGVALVVPIDPQTFRSTYNVPAAVQIFGPYGGALNNAGERLRLLLPDEPPAEQPDLIPYLLVDEVDYEPDGLWPVEADGTGNSLHRMESDRLGNDSGNWSAELPTPGGVPFAAQPAVAGRYVFYNRSAFDGGDPAATAADDLAIAPLKAALEAGGQATSANYTNYSRGINGIIVDIASPGGPIGEDDFRFHVGNDDNPAAWANAPPPVTVDVRAGQGTGGSDRVTILWDDYAIRNQWLQVTVLGQGLGLPGDDVFYFGNAVAETGNSDLDAQVTTIDLLLARNNPRGFLSPADVTFAYDYDRDGRVNTTDVLLARNNQTNFLSALKLIDLTGFAAEAAAAPLPAEGSSVVEQSSVHDAALRQVARWNSATGNVSAGELVWLYEYGQIDSSSRPPDDDRPDARPVDELLATYWP